MTKAKAKTNLLETKCVFYAGHQFLSLGPKKISHNQPFNHVVWNEVGYHQLATIQILPTLKNRPSASQPGEPRVPYFIKSAVIDEHT